MNKNTFLKLLIDIDVDDTWEISFIDYDMDQDRGYINFIKNEKSTPYGECNKYECDLLSVVFNINTGKIIKTKQSHDVDLLSVVFNINTGKIVKTKQSHEVDWI